MERSIVLWMITLAVFAAHCASGVPTIYPRAKETEISRGEKIKITCEGASRLDWDFPAVNDSSGRVRSTPSSKHQSTLIIENTVYTDTGYYRCLQKDDGLEDKQYIFVKDPNNAIILKKNNMEATNGTRCVIACRPSSRDFQLKLKRQRTEQLITEDGRNGTWRFDPKEGFILDPIYTIHADMYYCEYKSQLKLVVLNVKSSTKPIPKPKIVPENEVFVVGTNVTLLCSVDVDASMRLNLTWETPSAVKNFVVGPSDLKKVGSRYRLSRNLTLIRIEKKYSGGYTCIAENLLGSNRNTGNTSVTVLEPSAAYIKFSRPGIENYTEVKEGTNVTWIVTIDAYPRSDIAWLFANGTQMKSDKKYVINTDEEHKTTKLHILDVQGTDSGGYILRANNSRLNEKITLYLLVRGTPTVRLSSPRIKYEPGRLYKINCTAEGYPLPSVEWFFKPCENGNVKRCTTNHMPLPPTQWYSAQEDSLTVISTLNIIAKESGFVGCQAKNDEGVSPLKDHSFTVSGSESGPTGAVVRVSAPGIVAIVIVAIILSVLVGFLSYRIHKEKRRRKELEKGGILHFDAGDVGLLSKDLPIDEQADLLPYNKQFEFPKEKLKLGRQLGAGAFGVVVKANAEGIVEGEAVTTVAVKMVKRNAEFVFLKALASELKIMVHLGKHLNVVNLLGACTSNIEKRELYVIVEYCPYGNLHNYLLRHREGYIDQIDPKTKKLDPAIGADIIAQAEYNNYKFKPKLSVVSFSTSNSSDNGSVSYHAGNTSDTVCMMPSGETSSGSSNGYTGGTPQPEWRSNYKGDYKGKVRPVTTHDLICWAFQVARGMEYLVSRKVMHGDLAARNILLAEDSIVKICDFGLAKSIYKSDNYKKKGDGPLPVKWMALESIKDRIFSTQSDVWSYGIVLWEFFSLATTPYPGMEPNEEFYNKLVSGYRMEKPRYATDEIYRMMSDCWLTNPDERPTFTELAQQMGTLLDSTIRNHYISLNDPYVRMNEQWQKERSDYLNMLSPPTYSNLVSPLQDEGPENSYVNSPFGMEATSPNNNDPGSGYLNMSSPASPFLTTPEPGKASLIWPVISNNRKSDVPNGDLLSFNEHL